jgi:hypothetical protein
MPLLSSVVNLNCRLRRTIKNMKSNLLLCSAALALAPILATATPVLIVGTPANSQLSKPTGASPNLGGTLINFDSLTPNTTFVPGTYAAYGVSSISSPDGLLAEPFSTQSFPNELYDNSPDGTANITIDLSIGSYAIGVGIADSDPVSVTFQPLNSAGNPLGTAFTENLAATENAVNTGNGYYVIEDTTPDIFGLQITQPVANPSFSGLAIDDLQSTVPEPSSLLLLIGGAGMLYSFGLRKQS